MNLQTILQSKGTDVHTIGPTATLEETIRILVHFNIGSLLVCEPRAGQEDDRVIGIITERDILHAQADHPGPPHGLTVAAAMTIELITAPPQAELEHAMHLMTEHRVRHLPVMDQSGQLHGIVSIGDVVKAQYDELTVAAHWMSKELADRNGYWW
jgi:CBS domain-containing protein